MNKNVTAYPLCWPIGWERTPCYERKPYLHSASNSDQNWERITKRLFDQLRLLGATEVILSSNHHCVKTAFITGNEAKNLLVIPA